MDFQPNTVIQDHRGERRWKVISPLSDRLFLKVCEVADQAEGMLERTLYMMTLNYAELPSNDLDFSIQSLRDAFQRMVEILGRGSYTFLPEPVDFLTFTNNWDPMDPDLRREELGLVFVKNQGRILKSVRNYKGEINIHNLRSSVIHTLKTLKRLHDDQVVIQELPMVDIKLDLVTHRPYFYGIHTLLPMDDFRGYNPNRVTLLPSAIFSAPEVFEPQGRLTPATDIYAVGKLALQLVLGDEYQKTFTPQNPFPADVQNIINSLYLPPPWPRFLSVCLQVDHTQRYQNAYEAEIALMSEDKQEAIRQAQEEKRRARQEEQQTKQEAIRQAQEKQRAKQNAIRQAQEKQRAKQYYNYKENPQLPTALLLIWSERLTKRGQQFDFTLLYSELAYSYNLKPRLFFQTVVADSASENPFFKMLEQSYKLNVIAMDGRQDPIGILNHTLDPYLADIRHLILVGNPDEAGIQSMLQHPNASNWRIHWIRGQGNWNPAITVEEVIDMGKYLRSKPSKKP